MPEVLLSGNVPFEMEVPYELIETGEERKKPLIVYLHGFKQNISRFQRHMEKMFALEAFHLFIQGPYPLYDAKHSRKVPEWGRAWYLYDGEQEQFVTSLEKTSSFLEEAVTRIQHSVNVSRLALIGYSMGAYLAGYMGLSRPEHIQELVMIGGRIKTEVFDGKSRNYNHINVLALHGSADRSVESEPQRKSVNQFGEWGADTCFREIDEGHRLTEAYFSEMLAWFRALGYKDLQ